MTRPLLGVLPHLIADVCLQENRELGCTIIRLEVSDEDLDPNGAPFSFDIIDGNQGHQFKIDREGVITTAAVFDRLIQDTYILTIRVFDNGTPPKHADVDVEVRNVTIYTDYK